MHLSKKKTLAILAHWHFHINLELGVHNETPVIKRNEILIHVRTWVTLNNYAVREARGELRVHAI